MGKQIPVLEEVSVIHLLIVILDDIQRMPALLRAWQSPEIV